MNTAILSLGSNSWNKEEILSIIIERLAPFTRGRSPIYADAEDNDRQHPYLNAVVTISTELDFNALVSLTKEIEEEYDRHSTFMNSGMITLDIDVVVFNGTVMREKDFNRCYFITGYRCLPSDCR